MTEWEFLAEVVEMADVGILPASDEPHDPAFLTTADRLLRQSPTLLPAECLELYHRQYWFSILDSLEEDFPGLIRLIGKDTFWQIAEDYLMENPSRSFTLRHLGDRLPEHLQKHIADSSIRRRAVAVSGIEFALMTAFEAPEANAIQPERGAGGARFVLHPAVILLEQQANASDWLHDESASWLDDGEGHFHCAVWRTPTHSLRHTAIPCGMFRMLSHIREHPVTLHEWLSVCASDMPEPVTLTEWVSNWRDREWFVAPPASTSC